MTETPNVAAILDSLARLDRIEKALAEGKLERRMPNSWWRVRRNGKTKRWKTRPWAWRIPVKMGFSQFAYISNDTVLLEVIWRIAP